MAQEFVNEWPVTTSQVSVLAVRAAVCDACHPPIAAVTRNNPSFEILRTISDNVRDSKSFICYVCIWCSRVFTLWRPSSHSETLTLPLHLCDYAPLPTHNDFIPFRDLGAETVRPCQ